MKDQNFWKILDAVVRLEVVKGHLRWKISDVARLAGVQRTLIYYYFGKSKESILQSALKTIGDEFYGLSPERIEMWRKGQVRESILLTRKLIAQAPHICQFFFHWRLQNSDVRDELEALEKRYLSKLKSFFPSRSEGELYAFYAVIFGLVLLPELPMPVLAQVLDKMAGLGTAV